MRKRDAAVHDEQCETENKIVFLPPKSKNDSLHYAPEYIVIELKGYVKINKNCRAILIYLSISLDYTVICD